MTGRARANGEGSIFPYRQGYATYAWVNTPNGKREKKWVYGKNRDDVHSKWIALQQKARTGTVATRAPTVGTYLTYWLEEIIKPNRAPLTYQTYEPSFASTGSMFLLLVTHVNYSAWLPLARGVIFG
jgi:hypothetical protein